LPYNDPAKTAKAMRRYRKRKRVEAIAKDLVEEFLKWGKPGDQTDVIYWEGNNAAALVPVDKQPEFLKTASKFGLGRLVLKGKRVRITVLEEAKE